MPTVSFYFQHHITVMLQCEPKLKERIIVSRSDKLVIFYIHNFIYIHETSSKIILKYMLRPITRSIKCTKVVNWSVMTRLQCERQMGWFVSYHCGYAIPCTLYRFLKAILRRLLWRSPSLDRVWRHIINMFYESQNKLTYRHTNTLLLSEEPSTFRKYGHTVYI